MNELTKLANEVLARLDVDSEQDEREFDRGIVVDALKDAFALGRRAGMTEAAGICTSKMDDAPQNENREGYNEGCDDCAAAIEKARDAK